MNREGESKEPRRRIVGSSFIDKDERDSCSNAKPGTVLFWALYLLKGKLASREMILNLRTRHFASDDPRVKLQIPSCFRNLKVLKVNEPEFISSPDKVQLNIPIAPERGLAIFACGPSNILGGANSLLNLCSRHP